MQIDINVLCMMLICYFNCLLVSRNDLETIYSAASVLAGAARRLDVLITFGMKWPGADLRSPRALKW